jgi:lipoprotein-releasing system ATP-binding protein
MNTVRPGRHAPWWTEAKKTMSHAKSAILSQAHAAASGPASVPARDDRAGGPGGEPIIDAQAVRKTYRLGRVDVPVLRGVDLQVRPGEWVAILGASGSGKSTLLHLLGGLDKPDRTGPAGDGGRVMFEGECVHRLSAAKLDRFRNEAVGFVFQFYHLLPELSVVENVTLAAMIRYGRWGFMARRGQVVARAEKLLDGFGLGHRLRHKPAELSGGERQRVAIARALINNPRVLLADEPTGNLDRATGNAILDLIAAHRREAGLTMVMVTHDREVAARADRIVRLVDGLVDATGQ